MVLSSKNTDYIKVKKSETRCLLVDLYIQEFTQMFMYFNIILDIV